MAEVEWIKIWTDMFEVNRKIKQIELMKDGDKILIIWFKLLILAGRVNDGGAIYITEDRPYDVSSLAGELRRPVPLIKRALGIFEGYGMIEIEDGIIYLSSWEKYQSVDKLELIKEQNRNRKRRQREKEKRSRDSHVTSHEDVTPCHAIEEEGEKDQEFHSFTLSREEDEFYTGGVNEPVENSEKIKRLRMEFLGGKLGGGVVMLSEEQLASLCEQLSFDELNKYMKIVRDCEKNGQHYTKKTHYQAILDMAKKDRRIKGG